MRCEICGRIIPADEKPITWKTCCINKLHVFCSNHCLTKWTQTWLRHQEQIRTSKTLDRRLA